MVGWGLESGMKASTGSDNDARVSENTSRAEKVAELAQKIEILLTVV